MRNQLGLKEGDRFVVIGEGEAIILKIITPPKLDEFEGLLARACVEAHRAGIRKADLKTAISKARRGSR